MPPLAPSPLRPAYDTDDGPLITSRSAGRWQVGGGMSTTGVPGGALRRRVAMAEFFVQ